MASRATVGSIRCRKRTMSTQTSRPGSLPPPLPENGAVVVNLDSDEEGDLYDEIDDKGCSDDEERAIVEKTEEPGLDSLRGGFGAFGSLIRARRRATALSEVRQRSSNVTGRGSEVSTSTRGREARGNSLSMSVVSGNADLGIVDPEKAEMGVQVFSNGRTHKLSTKSNEAVISRPAPVLKRPNTSPGPVNVFGEETAESPLSIPPFPDLRRASSLHAHFDANNAALEQSRTLPSVVPSTMKRKRDDKEGDS